MAPVLSNVPLGNDDGQSRADYIVPLVVRAKALLFGAHVFVYDA